MISISFFSRFAYDYIYILFLFCLSYCHDFDEFIYLLSFLLLISISISIWIFYLWSIWCKYKYIYIMIILYYCHKHITQMPYIYPITTSWSDYMILPDINHKGTRSIMFKKMCQLMAESVCIMYTRCWLWCHRRTTILPYSSMYFHSAYSRI